MSKKSPSKEEKKLQKLEQKLEGYLPDTLPSEVNPEDKKAVAKAEKAAEKAEKNLRNLFKSKHSEVESNTIDNVCQRYAQEHGDERLINAAKSPLYALTSERQKQSAADKRAGIDPAPRYDEAEALIGRGGKGGDVGQALHMAARSGKETDKYVISALTERRIGDSPNLIEEKQVRKTLRDESGRTPMQTAALYGNEKHCFQLFSRAPGFENNLTITDGSNNTALHLAASIPPGIPENKIEELSVKKAAIIDRFCNMQVQPNLTAVNNEGRTAFQVGLDSGNATITTALLDGARTLKSPELGNMWKQAIETFGPDRVFESALANGKYSLLENYLQNNPAPPISPAAANGGFRESQAGDMGTTSITEGTHLGWAAHKGKPLLCNYLIQNGAELGGTISIDNGTPITAQDVIQQKMEKDKHFAGTFDSKEENPSIQSSSPLSASPSMTPPSLMHQESIYHLMPSPSNVSLPPVDRSANRASELVGIIHDGVGKHQSWESIVTVVQTVQGSVAADSRIGAEHLERAVENVLGKIYQTAGQDNAVLTMDRNHGTVSLNLREDYADRIGTLVDNEAKGKEAKAKFVPLEEAVDKCNKDVTKINMETQPSHSIPSADLSQASSTEEKADKKHRTTISERASALANQVDKAMKRQGVPAEERAAVKQEVMDKIYSPDNIGADKSAPQPLYQKGGVPPEDKGTIIRPHRTSNWKDKVNTMTANVLQEKVASKESTAVASSSVSEEKDRGEGGKKDAGKEPESKSAPEAARSVGESSNRLAISAKIDKEMAKELEGVVSKMTKAWEDRIGGQTEQATAKNKENSQKKGGGPSFP